MKKYIFVCSIFQAHIICRLLCSGDRYHGNEFNISLLLLAYAYCSGLEYICAWKIVFFVVPGERQREASAQAVVSWAAHASKRNTSNMQDLCWGFAKWKPSFSPCLLMLNAFWTQIFLTKIPLEWLVHECFLVSCDNISHDRGEKKARCL